MKKQLKKIGVDKFWRYLNTTFLEPFLRSFEDMYRMVPQFGFFKSAELVFKMRWGRAAEVTSFRLNDYRFPIYARRGNSDFAIFKQIFLEEEYNFKINNQPNYIIDAGAHCGFAAIYFANKFDDHKCPIISIEPQESNYALLLLNTHNYDYVKKINKAVWSHSNGVYLGRSDDNYHSFQVNEKSYNNDTGKVESVSLPEVIANLPSEGKGIFKIDIEGAEKEIFKEVANSWLDRASVVFVEPHDRFGITTGGVNLIKKEAKKYNFTIGQIGENIALTKQPKNEKF